VNGESWLWSQEGTEAWFVGDLLPPPAGPTAFRSYEASRRWGIIECLL